MTGSAARCRRQRHGSREQGNRSSKGFNCIACHTFREKSSGAIHALDLMTMSERLEENWFHHYVANPQRFSPLTIMPNFWPDGKSPLPDLLGGDPGKQRDALWQCHLQGPEERATGPRIGSWPVRGMKDNLLQRLDWTGRVPFEILDIRARPDGFVVRFTPESDDIQTYTHIYQHGYGSPEVDHTRPTITAAEVAPDGLSVRLCVRGLMQGHVHDFHLTALKSHDGETLLHDRAYYTLNEIPKP